MLEIRAAKSAKGLRIDVFRRYKHKDQNSTRAKYEYKQLGSFLFSESYSKELIETLEPEEIIQLKNWLAEVSFAEQFKGKLIKHVIRIPKNLYDAINRIYMAGKAVNIEFIPNQVLLNCLLNKTKIVQHKIDKINGFNSGILEKIGIDTAELHSKEADQEDIESRALFKALYDLGVSTGMGRICSQLEQAAAKYGKNKKIPPAQLKDWAGLSQTRSQTKIIKKWCFAIAIDVLQENKINPIKIIRPEKIAEYWAIQIQEECTLEQAKKNFVKIFSVPENDKQVVYTAIEKVYSRIK